TSAPPRRNRTGSARRNASCGTSELAAGTAPGQSRAAVSTEANMANRDFFQQGPQLANTWRNDSFLQDALKRLLPAEVFAGIAPGLDAFGESAAGEMLDYAADAERHPPVHVPYDPWGRRIDEIRVADGW